MIPIKKFFCLLLALALLAAAVGIIYPELLYRFVSEETIGEILSPAQVKPGDACLGLESFPLYGKEGFYGIRDALASCADYLTGASTEVPDAAAALQAIAANDGFLSALLEFFVLALLSIPVYMVLRFVPYNTLYREVAEQKSLLLRLAERGLLGIASGITVMGISWFLYNSVYIERFLAFICEQAKILKLPDFAMTVSNVFLIAVTALAVLGLLKTTLFRGSILGSVCLAVLRTLLFILTFACVEVFAGRVTLQLVLVAVAAVMVVGVLNSASETE